MSQQVDYPPAFQRILSRIQNAVEDADLDVALEHAERAIDWGERHRDPRAVDRGLCNRAGFLIARGESEGLARELQAVLMRSADPVNRHVAAYNLALLYDQRKDYRKCIFYGRIALDHARKSDEVAYVSRCHNVIANALVAESYFGEALDSYREALALLPEETRADRALILANAGYCHLVEERFPEGFRALYQALRMLRRLRVPTWERHSRVRLSLCYGYIELGRLRRARVHGEIALAAGEEADDLDAIRYALYLLGEVEKQAGDTFRAYRHFHRLQDLYAPGGGALADLLMSAETHKLVNLMA